MNYSHPEEQHSSKIARNRLLNPATQRRQNHVSESLYPNLRRSINQTVPAQNLAVPKKYGERVSFQHLLPLLAPRLDKDMRKQLYTLYDKWKIGVLKEGCLRLVRNIVGEQMLKLAVYKLQAREAARKFRSRRLPHSSSHSGLQCKCTEAYLSNASSCRSNQSVSHSHNSSQDEVTSSQSPQVHRSQRQVQHVSLLAGKRFQDLPTQIQSDLAGNRLQNPATQIERVQNHVSESMFKNLQQIVNQQTMPAQKIGNRQFKLGKKCHSAEVTPSPSALDPRMWQLGPSNPASNMLSAARLERQNMLIEQKRKFSNSDQQQKSHLASRDGLSLFTPLQDEHVDTNIGAALQMQSSRAGASSSMSAMLPSPVPLSITAQNVGKNTVEVKNKKAFGNLLPMTAPQLDMDRRKQLEILYEKLRANEVPKEGFVRLMRNIVGDQLLKKAVYKLQNQIHLAIFQQKVDSRNAMSECSSQSSQDMELDSEYIDKMSSSSSEQDAAEELTSISN